MSEHQKRKLISQSILSIRTYIKNRSSGHNGQEQRKHCVLWSSIKYITASLHQFRAITLYFDSGTSAQIFVYIRLVHFLNCFPIIFKSPLSTRHKIFKKYLFFLRRLTSPTRRVFTQTQNYDYELSLKKLCVLLDALNEFRNMSRFMDKF